MPPRRQTAPTWSVSTPSQVEAGHAPELHGSNRLNRDRLRKFRALKAGQKEIKIPTEPAAEIQARNKSNLHIPPENLCAVAWPGKADDQPPVFLLTAKGAEDMGTVLGCLGVWGEYYGAVQIRFPAAITSTTGAPSSWFPKTKQGAFAKNRPPTRTENVVSVGSTQGILVNEFKEKKWQEKAPLSQLLPVLEKAYETGDYASRTILETWTSFYSGDPEEQGTYRIDIDANALAPLHQKSPFRCTQQPFNLLSADKWVGALTIEGYQESLFYVGEAQTLFSWRIEDFYVHAADYQHFGAPKIWYTVPAAYGRTFEEKIKDEQCTWTNPKYSGYPTSCDQFVRHMGLLHPEDKLPLTPADAHAAGWRAFKYVQKPGDLIVTWPAVYYSGVNLGLNVNEAGGIGMQNWVNGGKRFRPCTCEGTLQMDWSVVEKYL